MRKLIYFAAIPTLLVLYSCAIPKPGWYKADVTRMDTESALAQCEYNVSVAQVNDERYEKTVNNCMRAQGFRYVQNIHKAQREDVSRYNSTVPAPQPTTRQSSVSAPTATPAPSANPAPASPSANGQDEWWK